MSGGLVAVNVEKSAAIITMTHRERRNALSSELITQLVATLAEFDLADEIRGIVVSGDGPSFSSGADLNEALAADSVPTALRYLADLRRLTDAVERCSKPVVAAIQGPCRTGGLEFALACDRRVAASDATFAMTSSRIGSVPGLGGTQRLPRLVGPAVAKDLLMTGRVVTAAEALGCGLVDTVVVVGEEIAAAVDWIEQCAAAAPISVWLAKLAVNVGSGLDLASALEFERLLTTLAFGTDDRREGMSSMLEKRPPRFEGR